MLKYLIFSHIYNKQIIRRYDDDHILHYYSYKDFPSLEARPMEFINKDGYKIKGYFYSYPNYKKDHLVIFCHGLGGGHRSYMKEIELLAKEGYEVLSYDYLGCFESEGKSIKGFTESIVTLNTLLNYLKDSGYTKDKKVSLVGHSWGGYTVSNILNYYKDIYSISVISGFTSIKSFAKELMPKFQKEFYKCEKKINPSIVDSSSIDAFKNTSTHVLIIHSKDDKMVPITFGADELKENINNPNVKYLIVDNKSHNPNYTIEAVKYLNECQALYKQNVKKL